MIRYRPADTLASLNQQAAVLVSGGMGMKGSQKPCLHGKWGSPLWVAVAAIGSSPCPSRRVLARELRGGGGRRAERERE